MYMVLPYSDNIHIYIFIWTIHIQIKEKLENMEKEIKNKKMLNIELNFLVYSA